MERGYVKLWRKTLDSGLLQHPTALQLFTYLLLKAAHKEHKQIVGGEVFVLKPGDVIITRAKAAAELDTTEKTIRHALEILKKLEIVASQGASRCTIVSFINWDSYQQDQPAKGPADGPDRGQIGARQGPADGPASSNINKNERIKELNINSFCAELSDESSTREESPEEALPLSPVISLPLNTGEDHAVLQGEVEQWQDLYPAVDVMQQLRNMRGWLDANPTRRKTKRGINKFIHHWLADKQDKGGGNARASPGKPATPTEFQKRMQEQRDMATFILERKAKKREAQNGNNAVISSNAGQLAGSQSCISGRKSARNIGDAG